MTEPFGKRLLAAMAEMPNPVKDSKAYNYRYEQLDQVLGIVQPALMAHGLFVTQGMEFAEGGYELRTCICDAEGDTLRVPMDCRPVKLTGDSQKDGSAETYARRYALKTVFGLCGEDDDGKAASKPPKYKRPVARREPSKGAAQDGACPEWREMVKAVSDYVDITGEPKKDVWERWGASVGKEDAEMCLAVIADIERALNG